MNNENTEKLGEMFGGVRIIVYFCKNEIINITA